MLGPRPPFKAFGEVQDDLGSDCSLFFAASLVFDLSLTFRLSGLLDMKEDERGRFSLFSYQAKSSNLKNNPGLYEVDSQIISVSIPKVCFFPLLNQHQSQNELRAHVI